VVTSGTAAGQKNSEVLSPEEGEQGPGHHGGTALVGHAFPRSFTRSRTTAILCCSGSVTCVMPRANVCQQFTVSLGWCWDMVALDRVGSAIAGRHAVPSPSLPFGPLAGGCLADPSRIGGNWCCVIQGPPWEVVVFGLPRWLCWQGYVIAGNAGTDTPHDRHTTPGVPVGTGRHVFSPGGPCTALIQSRAGPGNGAANTVPGATISWECHRLNSIAAICARVVGTAQ